MQMRCVNLVTVDSARALTNSFRQLQAKYTHPQNMFWPLYW